MGKASNTTIEDQLTDTETRTISVYDASSVLREAAKCAIPAVNCRSTAALTMNDGSTKPSSADTIGW